MLKEGAFVEPDIARHDPQFIAKNRQKSSKGVKRISNFMGFKVHLADYNLD